MTVASHKTEAVLLTRKRKISPVQFYIQGTVIYPSNSLKYLGVWLDTKLNFADHINKTITKAEKTVTTLALLMPNVGGARASKRRVLASVVYSQLLYAAPVWHKVTNNRKLMQILRRIHVY